MTPYSIDFACSLCQDANERNLQGVSHYVTPERFRRFTETPYNFWKETRLLRGSYNVQRFHWWLAARIAFIIHQCRTKN
jgi:hypothetical protein